MLNFLFRLITILALTQALGGCKEDPEEAANKLFVEATVIWSEYKSLPNNESFELFERRFAVLERVDSNLKIIISDYPESSLAVRLVTASVGDIDMGRIKVLLEEARTEIECYQHQVVCILYEFQSLLQSSDEDWLLDYYSADIAKMLMAEGDLIGARDSAKFIQGARDQEEAMLSIALEMAVMGNGVSAQDTFSEALGVANNISRVVDKVAILTQVMKAQAKIGDNNGARKSLSEALDLARGLADEKEQAWALFEIAIAQFETGGMSDGQKTLTRAVEIAEISGKKNTIAAYFQRLAGVQASAGDHVGARNSLVRAREAATSILDEAERSRALTKIEIELATLDGNDNAQGAFSGAFAAANSSPSEDDRIRLLNLILEAQAVSGDVDGASETVASIPNAEDRVDALIFIANAQADSGDTAGARKTLAVAVEKTGDILNEQDQAEALAGIAKAQADMGDTTDATKTIAAALTMIGKIDRSDVLRISFLLSRIAVAQAAAGDHLGARKLLAKALEKTRTFKEDEHLRDLYIGFLVNAQASIGDFFSARDTARSIEDPQGQAEAFFLLASGLNK